MVHKFPRDYKFLLGDRIASSLLDLHELLIEAAYGRRKAQLLRRANLAVEKLRHRFRLARDLKVLPIRAWVAHAEHGNTYKLRARLLGGAVFKRGGRSLKGYSWRLLEQQQEQPPLGQPEQQQSRESEQQHRVSLRQHPAPLSKSSVGPEPRPSRRARVCPDRVQGPSPGPL